MLTTNTDIRDTLQTLEANARYDFRRRALLRILPTLVPGKRVLDAGCGMGFMSEALLHNGQQVTSVDIELPYVHHATQRTARYHGPGNGVVFLGELPFLSGSFDTVVSLDVIEHVEHDQHLVCEFARVVCPHGHVVITVPALASLYGKRDLMLGHYRRYNKQVLRQRLETAGFTLLSLHYWNALGVLPYYVAENIMKRELPDTIRVQQSGSSNLARRVVASGLEQWLVLEHYLPVPFGLSLLAIAQRHE